MIFDIFTSFAGQTSASTLGWLALVALIAGISRGLTGFGAGMIFVPLASGMVGPIAAIGLIWTMDAPNLVPVALGSARRAQWRESAILFVGWLVATPFGLWLLGWLDPLTVRWIVCCMILGVMGLLLAGWSYHGKPTPGLALATGLLAGITGGLTGLAGPPIVMLWLAAATASAMNVRDNINLFFLFTTMVNAVLLPWYGIITWAILKLGLMLSIPYCAGVAAGSLAFRYVSDGNYRRMAYLVIGVAALLAIPWLNSLLGR